MMRGLVWRACIIAALYSGCSNAEAGTATIAGSDQAIHSLELHKDRPIITAILPPQHGDTQYIDASATIVRHVAEALQRGATDSQGAREIGFRFKAPAVSRVGHEHDEAVSELIYTTQDLRTAQLAHLDVALLLNLVERANAPAYGRHATWRWCRTEDHGHRAAHFCRSALLHADE